MDTKLARQEVERMAEQIRSAHNLLRQANDCHPDVAIVRQALKEQMLQVSHAEDARMGGNPKACIDGLPKKEVIDWLVKQAEDITNGSWFWSQTSQPPLSPLSPTPTPAAPTRVQSVSTLEAQLAEQGLTLGDVVSAARKASKIDSFVSNRRTRQPLNLGLAQVPAPL